MKKTTVLALALLMVLSLSSTLLTGCAGCGTTNENNTNDMVESTPAGTDEGIIEEAPNVNDQPDTFHDNQSVSDNTNVTDSNGNPVVTDGDVMDDAGNIVDGAVENVGNAAKDVIDGVGDGVKDLTE